MQPGAVSLERLAKLDHRSLQNFLRIVCFGGILR